MSNMSEFEHTPKPPTTYEEDIDQALKIARSAGPAPEPESVSLFNDEEWRAAGQAARRTVEADNRAAPGHANTAQEQAPSRPSAGKKIAATAGVLLATGAAMGGLANEFDAPEFSEETTTYTVEEGDGLWAAAQNVLGNHDVRDAIAHIEADPANIDVLKDGLQPGEQLIIPVSVEGYEADKE